MSTDTTRYLDLLEQRITLLGSLAEALVAARGSIAAFDIDGLEARIAGQQQLCADISALDTEIDRVQRNCAAKVASPVAPNATPENSHMRETLARLHAVQSSVQQLNDAHKILLQRSCRTVSALLNSYHTFAGIYSDPAAPRTSVGEMV
jgi:flagellar biosynthesis/type III secretory pathway chaperone